MATNAVPWFRPIFGNEILKLRSKNCEDPFERKPMDSLIPAKHSDDSKPSEDNVTDHVIGVYFTPLFCDNGLQSGYQSYQELTKMLIDFYNVINMNSGELKKLEVIQVFVPPSINQCSIVNLENNEETRTKFREALLDVPWFALPLQDEIRRVRLKHRYQAKDGAVVLLSARTGNILCRDCRERIREDPEGVHFPWLPRPTLQVLQEAAQGGLLPGGLKKGEGEKRILYESLDGYVKGIYFSAHWCPPCKAFTPQLVETYKKIRSRGHKFEIIFVSSDRSEESFETYLSTMPWIAVPYSKSTQRQELALQFDVHGIPTLVLIDTDGSLITVDGRGEVNEDPDAECFPWRKRLVNILTDRLATTLYHSPAIVLFLEGEDDEEVDFAENVLTPSAEWVLQNEENMDYQLNFFIALDSDTSESLRDFVGIEDASPLLTAIDFPINRFSTMEYGEEITPASVKTFVCNFVSNKLKFVPVISTQEVMKM